MLLHCLRVTLEVNLGSSVCCFDSSAYLFLAIEFDREFFPEAVVGCCCYICVTVSARRGRSPGVLPLWPDLFLRHI